MYVFSRGNIKVEEINSTSITLYYGTLVNAKKKNPKEIMGNE